MRTPNSKTGGIHKEIKNLAEQNKVYITQHAWDSMDKRNIKIDDVLKIILDGEILEEYPDDNPCPSCLIFGVVISTALHAVVALCANHVRIITVYEPDPTEWIDNKIRKQKGGG
ncbi:MAG: DUF4258 domain-containing protein [Thermoplasmata archaeon]|nr:DUF4258 domain-containing protein [Thermoplasmata archaeon]